MTATEGADKDSRGHGRSAKWKTLTCEVSDMVGVVTLTRPEMLNRFDRALHAEFEEILGQLEGRDDVRAVVLASTGKVFSAGGDFDFIHQLHDDFALRHRTHDGARHILFRLFELSLPLVVALQGDAFGLGATVVMAADAVVASRNAGIADSHVVIGLAAGDGGAIVWPVSTGLIRAKRHLLTGDRLGAEEAYMLGVVTDLVDAPEDVLEAAQALARRMAALPPLAVQRTKRALHHAMVRSLAAEVDVGLAHEDVTLASDDVLEALAAFKERRPATYTGR
jgi:enoyl-CoA hydratase